MYYSGNLGSALFLVRRPSFPLFVHVLQEKHEIGAKIEAAIVWNNELAFSLESEEAKIYSKPDYWSCRITALHCTACHARQPYNW